MVTTEIDSMSENWQVETRTDNLIKKDFKLVKCVSLLILHCGIADPVEASVIKHEISPNASINICSPEVLSRVLFSCNTSTVQTSP